MDPDMHVILDLQCIFRMLKAFFPFATKLERITYLVQTKTLKSCNHI